MEHLVSAGDEVVDADGEVLGLLKARSPPPVDDLQEHDLVPGAEGPALGMRPTGPAK